MQTKTSVTKKKAGVVIFQGVLKKRGVKVTLKLRANKNLENLLASENTITSSVWKDSSGAPVKYYKPLTDSHPKILGGIETLFAVGDTGGVRTMLTGGRPNIAPLRIKGLGKGVTIACDNLETSYSDLQSELTMLGNVAKYLWQEYIKPVKITLKVKGL